MSKRRKKRGAAERKPGAPQHPLAGELAASFDAAVVLHRQGNLQQAAVLYQSILSVDAQHADALHLLGVIAQQTGDPESACDLIARAIALRPRNPQFRFHLGLALQTLQRNPQAAEAYREAVRLKPDHREAHENLGVALQDCDDWEGAADAYRKAIALEASSPIAHKNLGTLLGHLGRHEEARQHFALVLEWHPALADVHMKMSSTLLKLGDFAAGWREYEWRRHADTFTEHNPVRVVPWPRWDGSTLSGRTILINAEQGIGDEIMFASCFRDVIAAAGHCLIECDPRLVGLFARSFPDATVFAGDRRSDFRWTDTLPAVDCRVDAGSLPLFFRTSAGDFPRERACLQPLAESQAHWRDRLARLDRPLNIGISWRGGRDTRAVRARSIPLEEWRPLFRNADANFINLQYGDHQAEIDAFHRGGSDRLHTLDGVDPVADIDGLVALISELDLVVSIDNSTVFMAGAVGAPTWVLLPSVCDWRWVRGHTTSPWHPSLALFQQREHGIDAWRELLEDVAAKLPAALAARAAERRTRGEAGARACEPASATGGAATGQNRQAGIAGADALPPDTASTANDRAPTVQARSPGGTAVLLNDTSSWYHFGCSCTSLALHDQLRRRWSAVESVPIHHIQRLGDLPRTLEEFDSDATFGRFAAANDGLLARLRTADTVYVNGEGTLHGVSAPALGLLYLAYVASTRFHRRVHIINHSCYPDDAGTSGDGSAFALYRKVYEQMDFVAVREPASARVVAGMGIELTESFDCLPLFVRDHYRSRPDRTAERIVIAGSVSWGGADVIPAIGDYLARMHAAGFRPSVLIGANAFLASDDCRFLDALHRQSGQYFEVVNATSERQWLDTIATASLLVSGRFHHTIAAACLDTPFLVMESNTPKVTGLLEVLGSQSFISATTPDLADTLVQRSRQYLAEPGAATVPAEVKQRLLDLGERNFSMRIEGR